MLTVLVTGPESSGTKMTSHLLMQAGAEVTHYTPRKCIGDEFKDGTGFDAVVLVVRTGYANARSMVENHHAYDEEGREYDLQLAHRMVPEALWAILDALHTFETVHVVTYESLVHEWPDSFSALCKDVGLSPPIDYIQAPGDANAKHFGGDIFRDTRELDAR